SAALLIENFHQSELLLLLPTINKTPQASPHLIQEDKPQEGKVTLVGWRVPALTLAPTFALDLLIGLPEGAPAGVVFGNSLRFFSAVAKLALELVARGRFLPAMKKNSSSVFACWQPIIDDDEDSERIKLLARAMPPLCRAQYGQQDAG